MKTIPQITVQKLVDDLVKNTSRGQLVWEKTSSTTEAELRKEMFRNWIEKKEVDVCSFNDKAVLNAMKMKVSYGQCSEKCSNCPLAVKHGFFNGVTNLTIA